jgi:S-DNA-T family DNA segregation ATPase FtsK/SpoIIIE
VPYDESENFMYQKDKTQKQPPFVKKDKPNDNTTPPPITKKETEVKNNEYEFNLEPPVKPNIPIKTDSKLTKKNNQPSFSVEDKTEFQEKTVENPVFIAEDDVSEPESEADKVPAYIKYGLYDPKLDLRNYTFPSLELLHPATANKLKVTREELESNKEKIVETLSHFNISIDTIKATVGPTVTLYEIVPQAGIKISKIKNLEDDIALSLSALGIRIIAPIPGRGTIGIEVPNKNREVVPISSLLATEKFQKTDAELPIVLGKTISNEVFMADLSKMPHLLMAGATGQGKSVGLNIILTSLLYKKHPAELKLVLVDPKKVELTLFNRIERHYLAMLPGSEEAIITDTKKVVHTLNSLCIEMDIRYGLLKDAACRNIKEYNEKFTKRMLNPDEGHRFLPYIVLVIDELADLMMTAGKEVETPIARLAQLARAIGIHLIVATQRPSVNVITGIIKANFPARLSFKVASKVDSRTILDTGGADQLVGQGDMLLSNGSDIIRLQCAFVATDEVEKICNHISKEQGYSMPYQLPEFEDEDAEPESKVVDLTNRDSMFEEAARLVVAHQQGSTSLIQRKLSLGYNRAGRIMDQLEAAGIVGAFEGSKARKVLIADEVMLSEILRSLA